MLNSSVYTKTSVYTRGGMPEKRPICQVCQAELYRTYVRNEKRQFVPVGWFCQKCSKPTYNTDHVTPPTNDSKSNDQIAILTQERDEYKELSTKLMEEHPERTFQTASNISGITTTTTVTIPDEVKLPADQIGKFFVATRNVKQYMLLKIERNTVIGWSVC